MITESLSSLDRRTLRERALHALREAIIAGQYHPGDRLRESELAEHLGVSRGTVRQALHHLQLEGLVTEDTRSTLRVNNLSSAEVRELFRVRAALEGLAVKLLMTSPDVTEAVGTLRAALSRLVDTDLDFAGRVEVDLDFHRQLCRLSGNSALLDSWHFLESRIRIVIMSAGEERAPTMMAWDRHTPIIDAIESADASVAVTVVNEHMAAAADHFAHLTS